MKKLEDAALKALIYAAIIAMASDMGTHVGHAFVRVLFSA